MPTWDVPNDMTVTATSLSGAVINYTATATDNVGVVTESCSPASGSEFPLGTTTVTCTATDTSGNIGEASFNVTVVVNRESVGTLIQGIEDMGLPQGHVPQAHGRSSQLQIMLTQPLADALYL